MTELTKFHDSIVRAIRTAESNHIDRVLIMGELWAALIAFSSFSVVPEIGFANEIPETEGNR